MLCIKTTKGDVVSAFEITTLITAQRSHHVSTKQ